MKSNYTVGFNWSYQSKNVIYQVPKPAKVTQKLLKLLLTKSIFQSQSCTGITSLQLICKVFIKLVGPNRTWS